MNNYLIVLVGVTLTYLASYLAKRTDLHSIEDPPLLSYVLLLTSAVLMYPVYSSNPMTMVVNALSIGIFSTVINFVYIFYKAPVIGAYDLVFLYLEGFALPPIPVSNVFIPTMLIHTTISVLIGAYKLKVKKEPFVRFFVIHEGVAKYLMFAYAVIIVLLWYSTV